MGLCPCFYAHDNVGRSYLLPLLQKEECEIPRGEEVSRIHTHGPLTPVSPSDSLIVLCFLKTPPSCCLVESALGWLRKS